MSYEVREELHWASRDPALVAGMMYSYRISWQQSREFGFR